MDNKAKLLIIDDEKIALKSLLHIMKKEGYEVVGTHSGSNALKLIDEKEFDVVLTDLRMEKVDGMQILKRCRELYPDIEVVMITGYATIQSATEAMKKGVNAFFKEKYPEVVSVYCVGDFSKEVCTGPHVTHTGVLGKFKIIKEESSSAGVRRIKAVLE